MSFADIHKLVNIFFRGIEIQPVGFFETKDRIKISICAERVLNTPLTYSYFLTLSIYPRLQTYL